MTLPEIIRVALLILFFVAGIALNFRSTRYLWWVLLAILTGMVLT